MIAVLTDPSILDNLKPSEAEVDRIFDHPLQAILDPSLAAKEQLVPKGSDDWPYVDAEYHVCTFHPSFTLSHRWIQNHTDVPLPWLGDSVYRMHRFRSTASPVKGLTADILVSYPLMKIFIDLIFFQIKTVKIAYAGNTTFEAYSPNQVVGFNAISRLLSLSANFSDASQSILQSPVTVVAHSMA